MVDPLAFRRAVVVPVVWPRALVFSPDGSAIAVRDGEDRLIVADATTGASRVLGKAAGDLAWGACGIMTVEHARVRVVRVDGSRRPGDRGKRGAKVSGEAVVARASREQVELFGEDGKLVGSCALPAWGAVVRAGTVAVRANDGLAILDAMTGERRAHHPSIEAREMALSPDGRRILVVADQGAWEGPCEGPLAFVPEVGSPAHAGEWFALGSALLRSGDLTPYAYGPPGVQGVAISAAGDRICFGVAGEVHVVTVGDLRERARIVGPGDRTHALAVDASRGQLAASVNGGEVCVWRLADASLVSTFRVGRNEAPIAWGPDGALLVGGHGLEVWDADTATRRAAMLVPGIDGIEGIVVRRGAIVVRDHHNVVVLDERFAVRASSGPWHDGNDDPIQLEQMACSPDAPTLYVTRGEDHSTLALSLDDGSVRRELEPGRAIAAGSNQVALSGHSEANLVDLATGASEPIEAFQAAAPVGDAFVCVHASDLRIRAPHEPRLHCHFHDEIEAVAACPSRERIYTGGRALWIAERNLATGLLCRVLPAGAAGKVIALAFDPTGERLAVGEMDARLHVWELGDRPRRIGLLDGTSMQPAGSIRELGDLGSIESLAFTTSLVACTTTVMQWDGDLGAIGQTEPRVFGERPRLVSRHGKRFVCGGDWGQELVVFDESGELSRAPALDTRDRFLDLSDDGELVLFGGASDGASTVTVQTAAGRPLGTLCVEGKVGCVGFDGLGDVVGWMDEGGPLFRWRLKSGSVERWCALLNPSLAYLNRLSRGGGKLVLWGQDGAIAVDAATGEHLAALPRQSKNDRTAVAMSDDGRRVAVGDWQGQVSVYALDEGGRCIAMISGTAEGGFWSVGPAGFTHALGYGVAHDWEAS